MTIHEGVVIDYGEGAFGPTVMMIVKNKVGLEQLLWVFQRLAVRPDVTEIDLITEPDITVEAGIFDFTLHVAEPAGKKRLARSDSGGFRWTQTRDGWADALDLSRQLLGGPGHQYLTDEGYDDALITVSYMEGL